MASSSTPSGALSINDMDKPSRYNRPPHVVYEPSTGITPKSSTNSGGFPQSDMKIDIDTPKRYTPDRTGSYGTPNGLPKHPRGGGDFVYVNSAYAGSLNSVNEPRVIGPPTGVYREQYWACSKWPSGQRLLAIAVGVLFGTVLGLMISLILRGSDKDGNILEGLFKSQPAPD